jgi:hypothetical protein
VERVLCGESIKSEDATRIAEEYPFLAVEQVLGKHLIRFFENYAQPDTFVTAQQWCQAPFPFISGLAGVLLYFEFIKSLRPDVFGPFQGHNYVCLNPMFPPNPDSVYRLRIT